MREWRAVGAWVHHINPTMFIDDLHYGFETNLSLIQPEIGIAGGLISCNKVNGHMKYRILRIR